MAQSGSGKSTIIKRRIQKEKPKRLVIWSPDEDEDNYAALGCIVVRDISALGKHMVKPQFKVVFWPSMDSVVRSSQFKYFCQLVFAVKNCWCLVEELRTVTTAQYAPPDWAVLSTRGRKKGIVLIGTSQRPSQIDKDFLGNCTEIYAGSLGYPEDRRAVAKAMIQPIDELEKLQLLQFIRTSKYEEKTSFTLKFPK